MNDKITSCPRCGSYDIVNKNGYKKCESCGSNLSEREIRKWHFINNYNKDW